MLASSRCCGWPGVPGSFSATASTCGFTASCDASAVCSPACDWLSCTGLSPLRRRLRPPRERRVLVPRLPSSRDSSPAVSDVCDAGFCALRDLAASLPAVFFLVCFVVFFFWPRCASSLRVSLRRPRCGLPSSRVPAWPPFLLPRAACDFFFVLVVFLAFDFFLAVCSPSPPNSDFSQSQNPGFAGSWRFGAGVVGSILPIAAGSATFRSCIDEGASSSVSASASA